ncbi:hypothetical protein RvY_01603 [Ramazzottius varieornatus]|uniref:Uncharacterized protein n=1 Tax=Ramazzottius varieornatus TaxID=947166 RepID=A0A1D1UGZ4_RAMVA|nr:hypothetical protein RvY_01603 [Ramazzottius varieornatus]
MDGAGDPSEEASSSASNSDQAGHADKRKHEAVNGDSTAPKKKSIERGIASLVLNAEASTSASTQENPAPQPDMPAANDPADPAANADNDMPHLVDPDDDENDWQDEGADEDDDEDDDEDQDAEGDPDEDGRELENDEVYKRPDTDPHLLISPPPPLSSSDIFFSSFLLRKEYGVLPGYRHPLAIRQKLAGDRGMLRKLSLWTNLEHHEGCVNALNFNPSGTMLASGSDDLKICLWDWNSKKLKYAFNSNHRSNVFQSKFIPLSNDSLLVSSARDGTVRMHQLSEAGVPPVDKLLARHKGACHKIDVRPDSQYHVMSCGEDGLVKFLDIRTAAASNKSEMTVAVADGDEKVPLYSIMTNPLKSYEFVLSGQDKYVRVYDLRQLREEPRYPPLMKLCPGHLKTTTRARYSASSAVYNYCGSEIIASYNDHNVFLFNDINTSSEVLASIAAHEYEGHRNNQTVKGVNFFGPRSEYVVSGSDCGKVFFWEKESQKVVHYLEADGIGAVNVLEPHPMDPIFATSGLEHSIKVWAPTGESPACLNQLTEAMRKNFEERKREYRMGGRMGGVGEGEFLMMLMQHLQQRGARADRAARAQRRPAAPADPNEMPPLEGDSESDDDGEGPAPPGCRMS